MSGSSVVPWSAYSTLHSHASVGVSSNLGGTSLFSVSSFLFLVCLPATAPTLSTRFYQGFKVLLSFLPLGLESEVTFAHDIPYEQVHEFY